MKTEKEIEQRQTMWERVAAWHDKMPTAVEMAARIAPIDGNTKLCNRPRKDGEDLYEAILRSLQGEPAPPKMSRRV